MFLLTVLNNHLYEIVIKVNAGKEMLKEECPRNFVKTSHKIDKDFCISQTPRLFFLSEKLKRRYLLAFISI